MLAGVWLAWQAPASAPVPRTVRVAVPEHVSSDQRAAPSTSLWRVVSRRLVSRPAFASMQQRLKAMQLLPITIRKEEDVTMHAFDDAILFKTRGEARKASRIWSSHNIESTIIRAEEAGVYLVGLGRFFQAKYAESIQHQLEKSGRKYRYQKRNVPITTWRFTFAGRDKQQAQLLWKKLHNTGVIMPILMPEEQFQELYKNMTEN